jgi:hypothetical protein
MCNTYKYNLILLQLGGNEFDVRKLFYFTQAVMSFSAESVLPAAQLYLLFAAKLAGCKNDGRVLPCTDLKYFKHIF